jgi:hypothetical protein
MSSNPFIVAMSSNPFIVAKRNKHIKSKTASYTYVTVVLDHMSTGGFQLCTLTL